MPEIVEVERLTNTIAAALQAAGNGSPLKVSGLTEHVERGAVKHFQSRARDLTDADRLAGDQLARRSLDSQAELVTLFRRAKTLNFLFKINHEAIQTSSTHFILSWHLNSTGWFYPDDRLQPFWEPIELEQSFFKFSGPNSPYRFTLNFDTAGCETVGLRYKDQRTWGRAQLIPLTAKTDSYGQPTIDDPRWPGGLYYTNKNRRYETVGPDWLFRPADAMERLRNYRTASKTLTAKEVLTNQKIAAGVGHYLATEALGKAGIHPESRWINLCGAARSNLAHFANVTVTEANANHSYDHWQVFNREGKPCPICESHRIKPQPLIQRIPQGNDGRSSYFCPHHQTLY